jgi:transcriptional regulator with XRE-family HTH domain
VSKCLENSARRNIVTVAEDRSAGSGRRLNARRPNELLRQARLRTPSPSNPARPMSQRELAEALTAHIFDNTARVVPLDRHSVSRWERGKRRYPTADYRAAFRAVLGAATDAELGFVPPNKKREKRPVNDAAATPAARGMPQGAVTRFVFVPVVVVIPSADRPVLLALVGKQRGPA